MVYICHGYRNSLEASSYGGGLKPNSNARGSGNGAGNGEGMGSGRGRGQVSGDGPNQLPFEAEFYDKYVLGDGNGNIDGTGRANGKIIL